MGIFNLFLNALFQVVVFTAIPFLWWLVTARKKENFLKWIGFKKVSSNYKIIAMVVVLCCFVQSVLLCRSLLYQICFRKELRCNNPIPDRGYLLSFLF